MLITATATTPAASHSKPSRRALLALTVVSPIALASSKLFNCAGGYSRVLTTVQPTASEQDGATGVERVLHRIRNPAGLGGVLNAAAASSHGSRLATTAPMPMKKLCIA